ncbi:MAG: hypothetical protein WCB15_35495 [Desulfobacterales bacterium]
MPSTLKDSLYHPPFIAQSDHFSSLLVFNEFWGIAADESLEYLTLVPGARKNSIFKGRIGSANLEYHGPFFGLI